MGNKIPKLGVVVPYRNRQSHLNTFKVRIGRYLQYQEIPHEIIIVNQDDGKLFNRGILLNIGFKYAEELGCDYVVFHDVDMIPEDVDYSYSDIPLHLSTNLIDRKTRETSKEIFDTYFGGVTMFPMDVFKQINGYSNKYWGWGFEDDDLLLRCKINNIDLDELKIINFKTKGTKLKLNGNNAYIKGRNFNNLLNFNSDLTLFISFYPDNLILNHLHEKDEFKIFSIVGFNTEISFNSYLRYNFTTFDENGEIKYINTDISTNFKTNICVTFDFKNKEISMYQGGEFVGTQKYDNSLHVYLLEQFFHIGCGINQAKELEGYFKGYFDTFAIYDKKLSAEEIEEIGKKDTGVLTQNGKKYKSANKLKLLYDTNFIKEYKLIDLSGNGNDGEIVNCEIVEDDIEDFKTLQIPFRRESTFTTLQHDENGFVDNKWKNQNTRWNQLRFFNEISNNPKLTKKDGLSDLLFIEHGRETKNNITHINVGI